jgi:hypothetical protein
MTKRIARKPSARPAAAPPIKPTKLVTVFMELPGAVFYDGILIEDIDTATKMQAIRASYESDDCQEMLWADCLEMGFSPREIRQFVTNPAAITSSGYGFPLGGTGHTVTLRASLA